uniref:Aminopeptidase n=1 Tax=Panagrolaimus sp. ES5 TaxID=591445 RepID=A0AC34FQI8_9BILA
MIQRLPMTLIPSLYILTLQVFLPYKPGVDFGPLNQTVVGSVIINFECRQDTNIILLNANDILIKNDSLKLGDQDSNKSLDVEVESLDNLANILKLRTYPPLAKGRNYTLLIHYGTRVRAPNDGGLFLGSYEHNGEKRYHVVSQMQPIESRKVFPCFDEPSFKARFQINIIHPTGTTAISNTEAVDRLEHKTNWTRTEFDVTPIMSTYLLAIAITDFKYIETTYRDIKLRIWAQPKLLNDTKIALNLLPKGLHFYEEYFNISYPLSKLDYYAVQELRVAAMENWGLITIQESSVVYNPEIGSLNSFSNVAMTVFHEMAHMWFGNLITMRWWNDLWLNEGFACHMSYKAMREITPELDVNFIFQYATFAVQISEEKHKWSPLSSNVTVNSDIYSAFNKINYNKGAAVIHMFESVVGEDVFRLSLQSFIKHHFYDNAISADFARSIGRTMKYLNSSNPFGNMGVVGALKSWTRNSGFPQLTVKRINETTVEISQQPCYTPDIFKITSHFRYSVPVVYTTTNNNNTALAIINNNETLTINDLALIDPHATCYCKILYDDQTWLRIAQQLQKNHTSIPTESRARLIYESNSFASLEKLNITISFELGKYIKNEIEPGPIQTFLLHMDSYQYIFFGNETKPMLR